MRFGFHVSIAGRIYLAVDRARERQSECMQIFASSPRSWQRSQLLENDVIEFKRRRTEYGIRPLVIHAPYLVNLASPSPEINRKSSAALRDSLEKAEMLGAEYVVFHVGNHKGQGKNEGLERIAQSLLDVLDHCGPTMRLLLENTSGAGSSLGSRFEEIKVVFDCLKFDKRLGLCLDTAHAHAAGYDISTTAGLEKILKEIDQLLGLDRLDLIHANDSKAALGSGSDRHENIGHGTIGADGFELIVNHPGLCDLSCVLETPGKTAEADLVNMRMIKGLVHQS